MGDRVIHAITSGISMSIAVASTTLAGNKRNSIDQTNRLDRKQSLESNASDEDEGQALEFEWALDEAGGDEKEVVLQPDQNKEASAHEFLLSHQVSITPQTTYQRLPQLVSIPQRRPKDRSRGFVRAYAPILGQCSGISAKAFIDFIEDFDRATRAAPIFNVINVACIGLGFAGHIAMAVSTAVSYANYVAKDLHIRYKANRFLNEVNEKFFKPRGLYVLIMSYQPQYEDEPVVEYDGESGTDDVSKATFKTLSAESNPLKKKLMILKSTSGRFKTPQSVPPLAPLVYPILDRSIDSGESKTNQIALTKSNIAEYLDRRAQVQAAADNRNLSLAQAHPPPVQEKQFVNRFCDPDHPVNSGSIFGLVTGGTWDPIAAGRVTRAKKAAKKRGEPELTDEEIHNVYMGRGVRGRKGTHEKKRFTVVNNILQRDLLYMCVVNLPTAEEMKVMQDLMNS